VVSFWALRKDWFATVEGIPQGYFVAFYFLLGWFSLATFFAVIFHSFEIGYWRRVRRKNKPVNWSRREFFSRAAGGAVIGLSTGGAALGWYESQHMLTVKRVDVSLDNYPLDAAPLHIVQVSDLHIGAFLDDKHVMNIVNRVNELKPDLVALTGDSVDGPAGQIRATRLLALMRSRYGTFYVTGNHEYYWGAEKWCEYYQSLGLNVLLNEHRVIEHEGARVLIGGIPDHHAHRHSNTHRADAEKSLVGAPEVHAKILLAHQPSSYKMAKEAGYDLQLSGHTHGGQFFPLTLLVPLFQPFVKGLHRTGAMQIYVNSGAGYWGPANRLGVAPEVTSIHVGSARGVA
jgi:predicted MPP superfamily phosphohydrolase